ncbi:MAG: ribosome silencing factor [Pyrinomonadaceae bacterium]
MEQTLKEKSLKHETDGEKEQTSASPAAALDERILTAVRVANEKKAIKPIVLDIQELTSFTEYFLITNGTNIRQVQAISDGIAEELRKIGTRPARIEGYNTAEWILMDYGDFVVHIFEEKAREFYDLERLWRDAKRVQLPTELVNSES